MSLHRFFADKNVTLDSDVLPLTPADVHHLRDVLRLVEGDEIVLVSDHRAERVRLTTVDDVVRGESLGELPAPQLPRVTLVQGLAKGDKMDDIVRQVTELGVARIIPLSAERSVVKLDATRANARVERWRRIAAEAAKQAQRVDVPTVRAIARLEDLPDMLAASHVLVCWEDAPDAPAVGDAIDRDLPAGTDVAVVVGPEGGLTPAEVTSLVALGAVVVSLGATVLRTETAGVVATALALYKRGGLGARHA